MAAFEFFYRKPQYLIQALGCTAMLVMVGGFAYASRGLFTLPEQDVMLTGLRIFFAVLLSLTAGTMLFGLAKAVSVLTSAAPAVAIDRKGIRLGHKHCFEWTEIDSVEYVLRKRTMMQDSTRWRTHHFLYVQPLHGRTIKFDLSLVNARPDEIFRSIQRAAPHINIRGWEPNGD